MTNWTEGRKAMLKHWWLHEQLSSTRIVELFAKEDFCTTRNAIIGAVHRSDWWAGQSRRREPPKPTPRKKREARLPPAARPRPPRVPNVPKPAPRPRPAASPGEPRYLAVTEIGFGECRFWFGEARDRADPATGTGFCAKPVEHGSWCPEHRRLVYVKSSSGSRPHSVAHRF